MLHLFLIKMKIHTNMKLIFFKIAMLQIVFSWKLFGRYITYSIKWYMALIKKKKIKLKSISVHLLRIKLVIMDTNVSLALHHVRYHSVQYLILCDANLHIQYSVDYCMLEFNTRLQSLYNMHIILWWMGIWKLLCHLEELSLC